MGFLRGRRDRVTTDSVLAATAAAFVRGLPQARRILGEVQHELVEWNHDGQLVRGRATGEIFGAQADQFLIGLARFVLEPSGTDVYDYPTKVLAPGGRFVDPSRT